MAELEEHNPGFDITVHLDGENKTITIQPDETSDGIEFYICSLDNHQITQIRFDDGKWDQLWGELDQEDIDTIGLAVQQKLK